MRYEKYVSVLVVLLPLGLLIQHFVFSVAHPGFDVCGSTWLGYIRSGGLYTGELKFVECTSFPYSPLFFLVWNLFAHSTNDIFPGRVISLIFTLLSGGMIYLIARRYTKSILCAVVPMGLFFISPIVLYWSTVARADMMALFFMLLGIYLFLRGNLGLSIIVFAITFFIKQIYVAAPIAVLAWTFFRPSKIKSFYPALGYLILLGVFIGISQACTDGNFFRHVFLFPVQSAGTSGISISRAFWSGLVVIGQNIGVILGLVVVVWNILKRKITFLEVWFIVAFLVMLGCIGKPGSGDNYGLESLVVGCILVGITVSKIIDKEVLVGNTVRVIR